MKTKLRENLPIEGKKKKEFMKNVVEMKKLVKQNKIADAASGGELQRGVVYLGHIPHGFYEREMKKFFSQFGKITRLKLSRNPKTTNSRGYAFIEFECDEVAKVVAETMDGYLLFNRVLKCKYVPREDVHAQTFKFRKIYNRTKIINKKAVENYNKVKSTEVYNKLIERQNKRIEKKNQTLKSLGINYSFPVSGSEKKSKQLIFSKTPNKIKDSKEQQKSTGQKKVNQSKSKSDKNVSAAVMLVDSSEDEITFKTPPNVTRVKKIKNKKINVQRTKVVNKVKGKKK